MEAAHLIGRTHDADMPLVWPGTISWSPYYVVPERVIPLCGPATDPTTCHGKQHAHRLDLLPYLTILEAAQAVADAGGIEAARKRLAPSAYENGIAEDSIPSAAYGRQG